MHRSMWTRRIVAAVSIAAVAVAVAAVGSVRAATQAAGPEATVKQFIDHFNKGDIKGAASTHASDVAIIDEFPPHAWNGSGAFDKWLDDLQKDAKAKGQSDQKLTLGKTIRSQTNGDTAYVVMSGTFVYKEKAKPMQEPGHLAFALRRNGDSWKITAWAWAGTPPRG